MCGLLVLFWSRFDLASLDVLCRFLRWLFGLCRPVWLGRLCDERERGVGGGGWGVEMISGMLSGMISARTPNNLLYLSRRR
jgi:hypothetical protein